MHSVLSSDHFSERIVAFVNKSLARAVTYIVHQIINKEKVCVVKWRLRKRKVSKLKGDESEDSLNMFYSIQRKKSSM